MSVLAIIGMAYAAIAVIELSWLAWDYRRKTNSPQVDVTGEWKPEGASDAPSPFDSRRALGDSTQRLHLVRS